MAKKKKKVDWKDVLTINNRTDSFLSVRRDANMTKVLNAIDNLEQRIINSLTRLSTDKTGRVRGIKTNLKQAQALHASILRDFEREYKIPMKKLTDGFSEVTKFVDDSYSDLNETAKWTKVDRDTMNLLRTNSYQQFAKFGDDAAERVSQAMYNSVIGGGTFSELTATMSGILSGGKDALGRSMSAYASTYAFDSIMNFNNQVNTMKAERIGLEHFMYVGDIIGTSRQFCKRRVMKIYTKEQIDSWNDQRWDGKAGPAFTYRGGYRCRHHWRGVRPEWFDTTPEDMKPDIFAIVASPQQQYDKKVAYKLFNSGVTDTKTLIASTEGRVVSNTMNSWKVSWRRGKSIPDGWDADDIPLFGRSPKAPTPPKTPGAVKPAPPKVAPPKKAPTPVPEPPSEKKLTPREKLKLKIKKGVVDEYDKLPVLEHLKTKPKLAPGSKYALHEISTPEQWLEHRQTWQPVKTLKDAKLQLKEKYNIKVFEIHKLLKNRIDEVKFCNDLGDHLSKMIQKMPALSARMELRGGTVGAMRFADLEGLKDYKKRFYPQASEGVRGWFSPPGHKIVNHFDVAQYKSGYVRKTTGKWHPIEDAFRTFRHEFGHHFQNLGKTAEWKRIVYRTDVRKYLSGYGATNPDEAWSEFFSLVTHPDTKLSSLRTTDAPNDLRHMVAFVKKHGLMTK
jgi:hypothetical protein